MPALRSLAVAVLVLMVALATPGTAQQLRRRYVSEGDCSQIAAFVPVPVERVRDRVPPGFAIVGEEAGAALVLVTGGRCRPWSLDGQLVRPMEFGLVSVLAHPRGDQPSASGYDLWWLIDARSTFERFEHVGFFTRRVAVGYRIERTPAGTVLEAGAKVPWSRSRFTIVGSVLDGPPQNMSLPSQHWHRGPHGRVRSDHENTEARAQPALVTISAEVGSPLARILGGPTTRIVGGLLEFHHYGVTGVEPSGH